MYISGRLTGLIKSDSQASNREGRRNFGQSLLLGVAQDSPYFGDRSQFQDSQVTPLSALCSAFTAYLGGKWRISFEQNQNSDIQQIRFYYSDDNSDDNLDLVCSLPFLLTQKDFDSYIYSENLILYNLNDNLGEDSNKNKIIISFSGDPSIHYRYGGGTWYHTTPSSQMELAYYKLRNEAENENKENFPLNQLGKEVFGGNFPVEIKFSIAQSIDQNMIVFRIYALEQLGGLRAENYFEKHYIKQYELILLKTQQDDENIFLWAEARCPEATHIYSTIYRDYANVSNGFYANNGFNGFVLRNLTAIDWWNYNCTALEERGNSSESYTFENKSVGGFHSFEELHEESFLNNSPLLYNKKYEIMTSDDIYDISSKYPQFLVKQKIAKTQVTLQSNDNSIANINIGEKCLKRVSAVFPFSLNQDVIIAQRETEDAFRSLSAGYLKNYLVLSPTYIIPCGKSFEFNHGRNQEFVQNQRETKNNN